MSKVRIGIVGVPGSGKTRFASALKRQMPDLKFQICDGYVEKLQDRLQMSSGLDATYLPNLHIASVREQEIRRLNVEDKNFIVCGTIFDTLCYSGFHAEIIANSPGDEDVKNGLLVREMTSAQLFAYMAVDSVSTFTHMFYLPVTEPDLLVAVHNRNNPDEPPGEMEALDKTLQDALRRFGNPATVLKEKHSANVKTAIEAIRSGLDGADNESPVAGE